MDNLKQLLIVSFADLRNDDGASLWVIKTFIFHHVYHMCDKSLHMLLCGQKKM